MADYDPCSNILTVNVLRISVSCAFLSRMTVFVENGGGSTALSVSQLQIFLDLERSPKGFGLG